MIIDHCRDLSELYNLYANRPMPNQYEWDFLVHNPHLFCFYDEETGKLKSFITMQEEDGELTLSGISVRKNMPDNIDAIITICNAFNQDIYSYTDLKHAGLLLKKAGFKKIGTNKYVRYKNNG
mgnify:CR=1 FL=1